MRADDHSQMKSGPRRIAGSGPRGLLAADQRGTIAALVVAAGGIGLATWPFSLAAPGSVGTAGPALAFLVVVVAASVVGRLLGGFVAAGLGFVALVYYFVQPIHQIDNFGDTSSVVALAAFVVVTVIVSTLVTRLRVARHDAEVAAHQTLRLQDLTAALSRASGSEGVYEVILSRAREALGATAGSVALCEEDGETLRLAATFGFDRQELRAWGRFPRSRPTPLGDAIARGGVVFVAEGEREARYPGLPEGSAAATMAVPLRVGDRTLGALGFRFPPGYRPSRQERAFVAGLADQCAQALERARLYDAERRSRRALELLAAAGEQLAAAREQEEALRHVAEVLVPAFADRCLVDLVDGERIRRVAAVGRASQAHAGGGPDLAADLAGESPVARVIRGRTPLLLAGDVPAPEGMLAAMIAPLVARGRTFGAITLGSVSERRFEADDLALAEQLAHRAALALDNARLFGEAQTERDRLEALLRQLPLGVLIAEAPSGRVVVANARATGTWRLPPLPERGADDSGELVGFHPDGAPLEPDEWPLARALRGETVDDAEIDVRFGDGTPGVVAVSAQPVRDPDGGIVAAVATVYDLSEHRRRETTMAFLAEASDALAESLDHHATLVRLTELAVPRLADWCSIDVVEGGALRNVAVAHGDPAKVDLARALQVRCPPSLDAPGGAPAVIRSGRSELVADISDELLVEVAPDPEQLAILRQLGLRSSIVAPLTAHGRTFGALTLIAAESGRRYDAHDLTVAEDLARRAALAIDNARLYQAQRDIAHTLQQSLLPGRLPSPPGMELAVRYRPAGEGVVVGGDFYDLWPLRHGFAIAVGDVSGKGPQAAALTALTRHTLRVAARYETSPERVLAVANETITPEIGESQFCTVAYAHAVPTAEGYVLTVACAGHPPPLLVRRDGQVLEAGVAGTLLGAVAEARFHDHTVLLRPGDGVAFWTDGVTERRRNGALFGEERLQRLLASLVDVPAEEVATRIEEAVLAFAPGLPEDDVAIVTLRVTGVPVPAPAGT